MTERESQRLQIFNYMIDGHEITDAEARELFKCSRLAARIADIEDLGFIVSRGWGYKYDERGKVVKKWRRYWIETRA